MARSNKVGELRVELVADIAKFQKGLVTASVSIDKAEQKVTSAAGQMARSIASMGARIGSASMTIVKSMGLATVAMGAFLAIGAGYAATRAVHSLLQVSETVDKIGKDAKRLGLTTEEMSALRYSATLAGVEFQQLGTMASKALKTVAKEVAAGHATMQLGRTTVQLVGINGHIRDTNVLFQDFARAVDRASDPAKKLELSQRIFGKAGADAFVTMLNESGGALQNLGEQTEELRKMGGLLDAATVRRLTDMNDAITKVGFAWEAVKVKVIDEFAPRVTEFMDWLRARITELPALARATSTAIAQFTSGDILKREKAAAALGGMKDAVLDLVATAAVESGKLLATAFVEALTIGLHAVAPSLEDLGRDIFSPLLNPVLKAAGLEPIAESISAQLKYAQGRMDDYRRALSDPIQVRMDEQWDLAGNRGALFQWMAERRVEAADLVAQRSIADMGNPEGLAMKIKSLQDAKAIEEMSRREALANAMAGGFNATAEAAARMQAKLGPAIQQLEEAKTTLLSLGDQEGGSPAAAAPGGSPLQSFADMIDGFWSRLQSIGAKAKAAGSKVSEGFKDLVAFHRELATRHLMVGATDQEARRIQLLNRFADEEADAVKRFGRNAQVLSALRAVQLEELQQFNAQLAKEMAEAAQRRKDEADALVESVVPWERFKNQRKQIEKFFAQGLIKPEFRKDFDDFLFRAEIAADQTFGGKLSQSIWDFRNTFNDSLADMIESSNYSFGEIARQFEKMLLRMALMQLAVEPFFQGAISFGRGLFAGPSVQPAPGTYGPPVGHADGALVRSAVPFWADGQWHEMGERGTEVIAPLDDYMRQRGGVTVNIYNQAGAEVRVEEGSGPDGQKTLEVFILRTVNGGFDKGAFDGRMAGRFNVRPSANRR